MMHVRRARPRAFLVASSGPCTTRPWSHFLSQSLHHEIQKPFHEDISFDDLTSLIKRCGDGKDLQRGRLLHKSIQRTKLARNTLIGNFIVQMYGACGCLQEATEAFHSIPHLSTRSWNIFIKACVKCGSATDAMDAFSQMLTKGSELLTSTVVCILDACSLLAAVDFGRLVHAMAVEFKFEGDLMVGTAIIKMYGKCKLLNEAWSVFDSMLNSDVITWSSMIALCTQYNHGLEAWELYRQMQHACITPDQVACLCALDACGSLGFLAQGQQVHISILETGCEGDVAVGTSLVNMYGRCAKFDEARSAFHRILQKSLVTWNTMVSVCVHSGHSTEALTALNRMQLEGFLPDQGTYVSALNACSSLASIKDGHKIHSLLNSTKSSNGVVLGTALSKMYGKCGHLDDAIKVFQMLEKKDVVAWCSIMTVCAENGYDDFVLTFFYLMHLRGFYPDRVVYVCTLNACGKVVDLDKGRDLHAAIAETSLDRDITVGTALIDMYGKCGSFHDAKAVFKHMPNCNIVTWSAMIAAYAHNGHAEEAIGLFQEMLCHDMVPNDVTFRSILTACSHSGQVDDCTHYFLSLCQEKGLLEKMEHRISMIDLLGRAGHLDVAESLIEGVAVEKKALAWSCLLGACKLHGDVERGERIASHIYSLDPENAASLITLLHLYAGAEDRRA